MRILGDRVYLAMPELPETKLELSPEFKKIQKEEILGKFDKLIVKGIGEKVINISKGDVVRVEPSALNRAMLIEIDGKEVISVPEYSIMHVW